MIGLLAYSSLEPDEIDSIANAKDRSWMDWIASGQCPGQIKEVDPTLLRDIPPLLLRSNADNRYAWAALKKLESTYQLDFKHGSIAPRVSLHVGTMPRGDFPGTRNWIRTGSLNSRGKLKHLPVSEVLAAIHPLTPLLNLPNLLGSELAMHYGFANNQSLFQAESSGAMALLDAQRTLKSGTSDIALVVSAQSFGQFLADLVLANMHTFNERPMSWYPKECGVVLLLATEQGAQLLGLNPLLELQSLQLTHTAQNYNWTCEDVCPWLCSSLPIMLIKSSATNRLVVKHLDEQEAALHWEVKN